MGAVAQKTMEKFTQIAETEITEKGLHEIVEAALQKCSYEKVFWKYAVNLQENIPAEVRFQ